MVKHLDGEKLILAFHKDIPDRIISMCKIFADDTSLFSKVSDINRSVTEFNTDLSHWAHQWKM